MLQQLNHCGPLLHFRVSPYLPCTGNKHSKLSLQQSGKNGKYHFPQFANNTITLLTVQPWILFASLWQRHIVWHKVNLASSRTHRSFSLAQKVVAPNVQDLAFPHVKLYEIPIHPFVQSVRVCLGGITTLLHQLLYCRLCPLQAWPIDYTGPNHPDQ